MPEYLTLILSLATPAAAGFAALTAYRFGAAQKAIGERQAETALQAAHIARNKLKLELFEKRLEVYNAAMMVVGEVATTGRLKNSELEYLARINAAKWLFNDEVVCFLEKTFWGLMVELMRYHEELEGLPAGPERAALIEGKHKTRRALMDQRGELDKLMTPFLRLES